MSAYDFYELYDVPKSEVDELIEDTTNKVVEVVLERAKNQVNSVMQQAEVERKNADYWNGLFKQTKKQNEELQAKINELEDKLNERATDIGKIEWSVGQAVYRLARPSSGEREVTCVTCNGKGRVRGLLGSRAVDATCPDCLGYSSKYGSNKYICTYKYYRAAPISAIIDKIDVTFYKGTDGEQHREVTYLLDGTWYSEREVSKNIDDIRELCRQYNEDKEAEALRLTGREQSDGKNVVENK